MSASGPDRPARQGRNLAGKHVTVVGLGRFGGGVGVARWLCGQQARVTVSDKADAGQLAESIRRLKGLDVSLHLGGHDEADFLDADLLVINPAVPPDMPLLARAEAAGVAQTTEINLFLRRCRARTVGVTGSVGKSTTTAMIGEVLSGTHRAHVGGNIGRSLLEDLPNIADDHAVVLELSSFQLQRLPQIALSPQVSLVTNLSPNHLDRHGSMEAYARAKKNIFRFQGAGDVLILNAADEATSAWQVEAPGRVEWFDPAAEPFELSVPGRHNQANAQAAWAAAREFSVARGAAAAALRAFAGLDHRLQLVAERNGVRYYDDSKCTTPTGAIVAMEALPPGTAVIIVGGYDKGTPFDELGAALAGRAKAVVALGATREMIVSAVQSHRTGPTPVVERADDLASAFALCLKHARSGDAVLLSPGCASYDMFTNYEQRGQAFCDLVARVPPSG